MQTGSTTVLRSRGGKVANDRYNKNNLNQQIQQRQLYNPSEVTLKQTLIDNQRSRNISQATTIRQTAISPNANHSSLNSNTITPLKLPSINQDISHTS